MKNIFLVLLLLITINAFPQKYNYPITPESEEWKRFESTQEMYNACQIEKNELMTMKTYDLILSCLDYPLISLIYAFNDIQRGFDTISNNFNGLEELTNRDDAAKELLKMYKNIEPSSILKRTNLVEKGEYVNRVGYIEIMLAQKFVHNLSITEKKELVTACIEKFKEKEKFKDNFGDQGTAITAWVISKIIYENSRNDLSKDIPRYIFNNQGIVIDSTVVEKTLEEGRIYIKN
ncbi:hypothetical protein [Gelatiniphilus marinus]|uniref:DUF4919 domain-containing protein n=1 Tax=Gelatiniphilus marinus TaxID=1759464 RepID=A0ABW5JXG0_9FLAO